MSAIVYVVGLLLDEAAAAALIAAVILGALYITAAAVAVCVFVVYPRAAGLDRVLEPRLVIRPPRYPVPPRRATRYYPSYDLPPTSRSPTPFHNQMRFLHTRQDRLTRF